MSYEPLPENDSQAQLYIDRDEVPPWRRVYNEGVDVTDGPELWPDWVKDPSILKRRKKRGRR
jgi:hypothetical protein